MNLILLGAPASGKGTLAKDLKNFYNIPVISTGDIIRENIKNETKLGKVFSSFVQNGNLVPDELIVELVKDRLNCSDTKNGYILDGFPRTLAQAKALNEFQNITKVICLNADYDNIIKRSLSRKVCPKCNAIYNINTYNKTKCKTCDVDLITRDDDNEQTIKNRFEIYQNETKPLIDFYNKLNLLLEVDANGSANEVAKLTLQKLNEK